MQTLFSAALGYAYNPDGSRARMTTPAGTFTCGYDADARPSTITNPFSEQSSWLYDNDSRLMAQTLSKNIVSSYSYNPRSFLTDLLNKGGSTTLSEFGGSTPSTAMAYDALGDITSVKASLPAAPASYSGTTTYQYDAKTELTQEATTRGGGFTHAFGYDNAENPTQFRSVAQPVASPDNQVGGGYDGNGNPSFVDGASAGFDVENRATSIGSLAETWGSNGLRASENGTTYYLYDGSVPVCELSSTGSVTATNTFGASGLVSRHTSSGSTFYTFDPMGNVAQRYTSTGTLVSSDLYDSFGSATSTAAPSDPFGYEGKFGYYSERGTSLILCGHRFYDSSAGRFINRDPIGYAGGINLYGYTGNNPTDFADPSGFVVDPVGDALWGLGAGVAVGLTVAITAPVSLPVAAAVGIAVVGGLAAGAFVGAFNEANKGGNGSDQLGGAAIGGLTGALGGGGGYYLGGLIPPSTPETPPSPETPPETPPGKVWPPAPKDPTTGDPMNLLIPLLPPLSHGPGGETPGSIPCT